MSPPKTPRGFFEQLARDDAFRTKVSNRKAMRDALEEYGISFSDAEIPKHLKPLPKKEEIETALEDLDRRSVFDKPIEEQKAAIVQKVWPAIPLVASVEAGDALPG